MYRCKLKIKGDIGKMLKTFLAVLFCSFLISLGSTTLAQTQVIEVIDGVTYLVTYGEDGSVINVIPVGH